jgi:hypothetical protein
MPLTKQGYVDALGEVGLCRCPKKVTPVSALSVIAGRILFLRLQAGLILHDERLDLVCHRRRLGGGVPPGVPEAGWRRDSLCSTSR